MSLPVPGTTNDIIPQDKSPDSARFGKALKVLVQILLLVGGICIMYLPPIQEQLGNIHGICEKLHALGWSAPVVFILSVAVLVAVGVPRLMLCPIGGMAFGFFWGLLWTQIGTILGFYGTFLLVRWAGQDFILTRWPRLKRFTNISGRSGIITVLLARQLPIPGFYITILLGLLPLSNMDFILGTAIGILPAAIPATLLGSTAIHISSGKSIFYSMLVIAAFIIVWTTSGRLLRTSQLSTAGIAGGTMAEAEQEQTAVKDTDHA